MKNITKLLVIVLLFSCSGKNSKSTSEDQKVAMMQALKDSISAAEMAATEIHKTEEENNRRIESNRLMKDSLEKALKAMKDNFIYKYDEFNKIGWYTHKTQTTSNSYNRKLLEANVNSEGYIYLEDQYYADDWIFHESITVKIGEKTYDSDVVPTYNSNNRSQNSSGSVWENISYTGKKDNGILKAIAECGNEVVKVRFHGKEYYSDFTLAAKDRKAIQDSYKLSQVLSLLNEIKQP